MLKLVTAPTVEPVTLSEVKAHCVIGHNADDTLLGVLISAAREHGEALTGRSWAAKTLEVVLDAFPRGHIELPASPIIAVASVKYLDADGAEQTLPDTDYTVDTDSLVGRVVAEEWPETDDTVNAVRVRYTAGWTPSTLPVALKQWLLIRIASLYAQRESFMATGNVTEMSRSFVDGLLDAHTVLGGI
jgi:uncharacterized phiE125 gp8 family phage protein